MTVTEKIIEHIRHLPEPVQVEVLDFVEYLKNKAESEDRSDWSAFSLSEALRDMESEAYSYSEKDLKEVFA
ncbi:MAG TPA: DUF2281 domain-containing protein [Firmicutes bacterium]|nr:DUF2281 domain-containing protein [Bacillota bacterium]